MLACTVCRFADGGDMSPPYNRFLRFTGFLREARQGCRALQLYRTPVGRGHVPAVREAADGTNEQICTQPEVPAPVGTCPHPTEVRPDLQQPL